LTGAGADTLSVGASTGAAINVDAGSGSDKLTLTGDSLTFAMTSTSFTNSTRKTVTHAGAELLRLTAGVFHATGSVSPRVEVLTGATLGGTGTVTGALTVKSGGKVDPGIGGPGILGTANTVFETGSTFQVQLNGLTAGTQHDRLVVSGTVNLGGATLAGSVGFTSIPGDEFVVLRNDGSDAVVGKFAQGDLAIIGGVKFAIDYAYEADGDGQFNDVALIRYGAQLAPDPCDPRRNALFVSATTGDDVIRFVSVAGSDKVRVLINGESQGEFRASGLLIGFGQAGNDAIYVELPSREAWLYGQNGDDVLRSGNGNSLLNGGLGNDSLTSGNGKDTLIGGLGADVLNSGSGEDILMAGATVYDRNTAANRLAWCRIVDEWSRGTGGYQTRIKNLLLGGGRNGSVVLNSGSLLDDSSVDQVFGGNGSDWFLLNTSGGTSLDLSDRTSVETATDL
jgi:Ca2+-binding RTX toxin-like protein